jgi:nicotinamide mononucleotide transporter
MYNIEKEGTSLFSSFFFCYFYKNLKYMVIEFIAVLFSIISVALAIKQSLHTWTFGIVGIISYGVIFYQQKLYADMMLQFLFIGMAIWGYLEWKGKVNFEPRRMTPREKDNLVHWMCMLFLFSWFFFRTYTDNSMPALDSLATVLSIYATILMVYKNRECWTIWMIADVVYVVIFLANRMYLSASLYVLFFFMAKKGYRQWNKL